MSGLLNGHCQPCTSPVAQTAPHILQPVLAYKPSGCRWQHRRDTARCSTSLSRHQESGLQQKSWPCKRRRGPGRKGTACHSTNNGHSTDNGTCRAGFFQFVVNDPQFISVQALGSFEARTAHRLCVTAATCWRLPLSVLCLQKHSACRPV